MYPIFQRIFNKNRPLQKKITIAIIACVLCTFFVLASTEHQLIQQINNLTLRTMDSMSNDIIFNSTDLLLKNEKQRMMFCVNKEASIMAEKYDMMRTITRNTAREMTQILSNPQDYPPREIKSEKYYEDGSFYGIVEFPEGCTEAELANLRKEAALTLNIEDYMIAYHQLMTVEKNQRPALLIGSASGIFVDLERFTQSDMEYIRGTNYHYDYKSAEWYRKTEQSRQFTFTKSNSDLGGIVVSYSSPYYRNGEFAGIASICLNVDNVGKSMFNMDETADEWSFMTEMDGSIIASEKTEGFFGIHKNIFHADPKHITGLDSLHFLMNSQKDVFLPFSIDGRSYYLTGVPVKEMNTYLFQVFDGELTRKILDNNDSLVENVLQWFKSVIAKEQVATICILLLLILFLLGEILRRGHHITHRLMVPLKTLIHGMQEIGKGNFSKKIKISSGDEIEELANSFNHMAEELVTQIQSIEKNTKEKAKLEADLSLAKNIQASMLPHDFRLGTNTTEVYATMTTAKEVGGDFYDFYLLDETHLVLTIADVSGKGIPAALFMMRSKTVLKNYITMMAQTAPLSSIVSMANDSLCQENEEMLFVTAFLAILDLKTGKLTYVNAGHNPPFLLRSADQQYSCLNPKKNLVLGMMDSFSFEQQELFMQESDLLFLYTDGVTEAMNDVQEQYGEARLSDCLNQNASLAPKELLMQANTSVTSHAGNAEQSDDITMLAACFRKKQER